MLSSLPDKPFLYCEMKRKHSPIPLHIRVLDAVRLGLGSDVPYQHSALDSFLAALAAR